MRAPSVLAGALAALALAASAHAQAVRPTTFVSPAELNLPALLPPPPADDSLAGRADLEAVLGLQGMRTRSQEDEATADAGLGALAWAQKHLGSAFNGEDYPKALALLEDVRKDGVALVHAAKTVHPRRDRPVERDERVWRSLPGGHNDSAYPSARAIGVRIWTGVLGDVFPMKRAELEAQADRSAWMRVTGGSHYPTDIAGSRIVADAFLSRLRADPDYRRRLAEARAEAQEVRAPPKR